MNKTTSGFTLVELLIVIVVVAILAAVSTVAYSGVQSRAHDTSVQADLRQIGGKIQHYQILNGAPPTPGQLRDLDIKVAKMSYKTTSNSNLLYCRTGEAWGLIAQSKSDAAYKFIHTTGLSKHIPAWTPNSNANLCSAIGFSNADPDYEYAWMHLWTTGWESWVQG